MNYSENQTAIQIGNRQHSYRHQLKRHDDLELIIRSGCDCIENCLMRFCEGPHNYSRGIKILNQCRSDILCLSQKELNQYLKCKLLALNRRTVNSYTLYDYSISFENKHYPLCSTAFALCYGITKYQLKAAKKTIKLDFHSVTGHLHDKSKVKRDVITAMNTHLEKMKVDRRERNHITGLCQMTGNNAAMMVNFLSITCSSLS